MELTIAAARQEPQRKPPLHLLTEGVQRSSAASACNHPDIASFGVRCLEELTGTGFVLSFGFSLVTHPWNPTDQGRISSYPVYLEPTV
jgi:hypothetical protein